MLFRGPRLLLCGPYYTATIVLYDFQCFNLHAYMTLLAIHCSVNMSHFLLTLYLYLQVEEKIRNFNV